IPRELSRRARSPAGRRRTGRRSRGNAAAAPRGAPRGPRFMPARGNAMSHAEYDIIGVGIGPFNLGLAALGSTVPELRMRLFERNQAFEWHPGMLIEGTSLQVSFLADLVTTVDPCNPLSFLAYLKHTGRLYQFAIRDT